MKSITQNEVLENSKEFKAGILAAERAFRSGVPTNRIYYEINIPKYIINSKNWLIHSVFGMGVDYACKYLERK